MSAVWATLLVLAACSSPDSAVAEKTAVMRDSHLVHVKVSVRDHHVTMTVGSELDVSTFNVPVLPETMALTVKYDCDPKYLLFLRLAPAEGEGSMMQHLFFRAVRAGETELQVRLVDKDGAVHQQARLAVTIKPK